MSELDELDWLAEVADAAERVADGPGSQSGGSQAPASATTSPTDGGMPA